MLLAGFSFIIRYSHWPFFAFYLSLLAMYFVSPGFILPVYPQAMADLRRGILFRRGTDPRRTPAGHGHSARLARAIKAVAVSLS